MRISKEVPIDSPVLRMIWNCQKLHFLSLNFQFLPGEDSGPPLESHILPPNFTYRRNGDTDPRCRFSWSAPTTPHTARTDHIVYIVHDTGLFPSEGDIQTNQVRFGSRAAILPRLISSLLGALTRFPEKWAIYLRRRAHRELGSHIRLFGPPIRDACL